MAKTKNTSKLDTAMLKSFMEGVCKRIDETIERDNFSRLIEKIDELPAIKSITLMDNMLTSLHESADGSKIIAKMVKEVKENKPLRGEFNLYNHLNNNKYIQGTKDPATYVNEALSIRGTNRPDLKKYHEILKEGLRSICKTTEDAEKLLNTTNNPVTEAFTYLTENKKTIKNVGQWVNNLNVLTENVKKLIEEDNAKTNTKVNVENLKEELDKCDKEWRKDTLIDMITEEIAGGNNRQQLFETYKDKCLSTIDESLNRDDKEETIRLTEMKNKLDKKSYNGLTYYEDMMLMAELNNTLLN